MKRLVILGLVCGIPTVFFAQSDSEPCCAVIQIDAVKNEAYARDKTSGRLHLFRLNSTDLQSVRKGDDVNVADGKVISVKGAKRSYATLRPTYGAPCCAVVSIQPEGAQACCAEVAVKNNANRQTYKINVAKELLGKLKVGYPVLNDSVTGLAILQTSIGSTDGEMVAYGFPIEGGSGDNPADKWVITPNNLKGSSGRLLFDNPVGSIWDLYIYNADDKYVTSYANVNNKGQVTVVPGQYRITINNAPVHDVPVRKGHDTKLKCGLLDVVSNGVWYLKDATGKISHTSGAKPTKLLVPVGNYTFELEGQNQPLIIKNGETVEM